MARQDVQSVFRRDARCGSTRAPGRGDRARRPAARHLVALSPDLDLGSDWVLAPTDRR